MSVLQ
ncbi:hypothetical protein LINPERHAP2_LOCUS21647 [Linum perenne]